MAISDRSVFVEPVERGHLSLSLRQRILLVIALAGLPGIVVAVYLAVSWLKAETQQIEVAVERLARLAAARHETIIENAQVVVAAVAAAKTVVFQDRLWRLSQADAVDYPTPDEPRFGDEMPNRIKSVHAVDRA